MYTHHTLHTLHYHISKDHFISEHKLPSNFDFETYFQLVYTHEISEMLDVDPTTWIFVLVQIWVVFGFNYMLAHQHWLKENFDWSLMHKQEMLYLSSATYPTAAEEAAAAAAAGGGDEHHRRLSAGGGDVYAGPSGRMAVDTLGFNYQYSHVVFAIFGMFSAMGLAAVWYWSHSSMEHLLSSIAKRRIPQIRKDPYLDFAPSRWHTPRNMYRLLRVLTTKYHQVLLID